MIQEEWIKHLRDKLADHQETPSDDLWAGIESRLDGLRPQQRPAWRRWAAAAAFLLLLAGGTMVLWNRGEHADFRGERGENRVERIAEAMKSAKRDAVEAERIMEEQVKTPKLVAQNHTKNQFLCVNETQKTEPQDAETEETQTDEPQTIESPEISPSEVSTTNPSVAQTMSTEKKIVIPQPQDPFTPVKEIHHDSRQLLAALYTGNGFENGNNIDRVQMSQNMAQKYNAMNTITASRSDAPIWLANYEEREHHERPFTIGLQLRYPLNERLSLNSGIVYTRLKSEFTKLMKGNEVEQQQLLHYIGVPLGLQYRLLQLGPLSLYASAGGQVDWNVSARMGVNGSQFDMDKDRWQWSLNGGLGVACDVTPRIALFVEPGVKYYIDNHSPVKNYFKDKPTNFSVQVGLQLIIGNK